MTFWLSLAAACCAVSAASCARAEIAPQYTLQVVDLTSVGGGLNNFRIEGLNDSGQMLVEGAGGTLFGNFFWDPAGNHAEIPLETVDGLNNNGIVVGHGPKSAMDRGIDKNTFGGAWNYHTGDLREVPTWLDDRPDIHGYTDIDELDESVEMKMFDINDQNIAVGRTKRDKSPSWRSFAYDYDTGEYIPFPIYANPMVGSQESFLADGPGAISDGNVVLGSAGNVGVLWSDVLATPTIESLPDSLGTIPGPFVTGTRDEIAINDAGVSLVRFFDTTAFGLVDADLNVLGVLPNHSGAGNTAFVDLNDAQVAIGYYSDPNNSSASFQFLWSQTGGIVPINGLLAPELAGWRIDTLFEINDAGQIAAKAYDAQGRERLVLLNPVPEPSTAVLGVAGLLGFLFAVRAGWLRSRRLAGN